MSEWRETTLGATFDLVRTKVAPTSLDTTTPYVGMEHFTPEAPRIREWTAASEVASQVGVFEVGDVLFGRLRPYLRKVALADFDGVASTEVLILRPRPEVAESAFVYLLASSRACIDYAVAKSAGSRMPRTSAADLAAFPIALPPLAEQRRIVDVMAAVDAQIEALEAEAGRLDSARQILAERLIFCASHPVLTVADLAVPKGLVGGPFGSNLTSKDYVDEGVPVIRGTNMSQRLVGGEFVYVSNDKAATMRGNQAIPGDVVFTQRGTLGQTALVSDEHPLYIVSQSQMRLRVNARSCANYVFHAFRTPRMVAAVQGRNTATANPHINLGILAGMQIPVPDRATQVEICTTLDRSLMASEAVATELATLRTFRSTLLTALLSQQIEIPESYDSLLEAVS